MTHKFVALILAMMIGVAWASNVLAATKKEVPSAGQITPVDLNTATQDQLERLPGIGARRARAIIAGRPYVTVDDLMAKGLVSATVWKKIKNNLTVASAAPTAMAKEAGKAKVEAPAASSSIMVDLNAATAEELEELPRIGPNRAKAIIAARPYATVSDLISKGVVSRRVFARIQGRVAVGTDVAKSAPKEVTKSLTEEEDPLPPEPTGRLDLNSATREELEALQGIGPDRAATIVAGRPYDGPGELVTKGILSQSVFDNIRGSIEVANMPSGVTGSSRELVVKRLRTCGAEWWKNKAAGTIASGETWPEFWNDCSKRLKVQGL